MNIVLIGSGNTAAVLGRKFVRAGHEIVQIMSRNPQSASELAYEWNTESANYMTLLNRNADVYIIAVNDGSIAEVVAELRLPGKVVAHTAAAISKDVLKMVTAHYGVVYPLQSLVASKLIPPPLPLYYDGSDDRSVQVLAALANSVSEGPAVLATDDQRMKLHVAAVVVNNFTNHLYALAANYCRRSGIDFRQLLPIIEETTARLKEHNPSGLQTGPAARGDQETISRHQAILEDYPALHHIYKIMSDSIARPAGQA